MSAPIPMVMEVDKTDLFHTRFVPLSGEPLGAGQVRLSIDHFALTANNITYAAFGDAMKYWNFFPSSEPGWGRVPVWGFATVSESNVEAIEPGERFYGYFPMAHEVVVEPEKIRADGFSDGATHRDELSAIYNRYVRIANDPGYKADFEHQQMLFRPLFTTSFLIEDQIAEADFHGAEQVICSSASSKTAIALAWLLRDKPVDVIGLTSSKNRAFVKNSGAYNASVLYDDIGIDLAERPSVFVDFAGNADVRAAVHERLQDNLKASIMVGATDWQKMASTDQKPLPGPEPQFFFAPDQGAKRAQEWGPDELERRVASSLVAFYEPASRWIKSVRVLGPEAMQEAFDRALKGTVLPSEGYILSFEA